jgi:hypothetical protein
LCVFFFKVSPFSFFHTGFFSGFWQSRMAQ